MKHQFPQFELPSQVKYASLCTLMELQNSEYGIELDIRAKKYLKISAAFGQGDQIYLASSALQHELMKPLLFS